MLWKIFYDDSTTFSDDDGPIFVAPGWGVVTVVQADTDVGREILSGYDYYLFDCDSQKWIGVNRDGLDDQLLTVGIGRMCIKKGRALERSKFKAFYALSMHDSDFPVKSAKHPDESGAV